MNGVTTKYFIEGDRIVLEKAGNEERAFWYDGNGNAAAFVIYDAEGMHPYYYFRNGQGDIIGLFDGNGNIVARYSYDSWGNLLSIKDGSGNDKTNDTTFVGYKNPLRYRGYYYDSETKLYYLQSRYYNPEWGRFLNADGYIGANGDLVANNLFTYCSNNPVMFMDPSGHIAEAAGVLLYLLYQAAKAVFVAAVAATAATVAVVAGAEVGKAISNSYPKTDGSSALQQHEQAFKPELKLFKNNKKQDPVPFISPLPNSNDRQNAPYYYHVTTKVNAVSILSSNKMNKGEFGYVYAWKSLPDEKAINICGSRKVHDYVIIAFRTNASFSPDNTITDPYAKRFSPVRTTLQQNVYIWDAYIVG